MIRFVILLVLMLGIAGAHSVDCVPDQATFGACCFPDVCVDCDDCICSRTGGVHQGSDSRCNDEAICDGFATTGPGTTAAATTGVVTTGARTTGVVTTGAGTTSAVTTGAATTGPSMGSCCCLCTTKDDDDDDDDCDGDDDDNDCPTTTHRTCENAFPEAGCSVECSGVSSCTFFENATCVHHTCPFGAACGDGAVDHFEACDDHNLVDGDGCSSHCEVEICDQGCLNGTITTVTTTNTSITYAFSGQSGTDPCDVSHFIIFDIPSCATVVSVTGSPEGCASTEDDDSDDDDNGDSGNGHDMKSKNGPCSDAFEDLLGNSLKIDLSSGSCVVTVTFDSFMTYDLKPFGVKGGQTCANCSTLVPTNCTGKPEPRSAACCCSCKPNRDNCEDEDDDDCDAEINTCEDKGPEESCCIECSGATSCTRVEGASCASAACEEHNSLVADMSDMGSAHKPKPSGVGIATLVISSAVAVAFVVLAFLMLSASPTAKQIRGTVSGHKYRRHRR